MKTPLARQRLGRLLIGFFLAIFCFAPSLRAQVAILVTPDWSIELDDFGYADFALDQRPGFEGREYLSGEWAAAIAYTQNSFPMGPNWVNAEFLFPDWTPISGFFTETPAEQIGVNSFQFEIFRSVVSDGSVRIAIVSQMVDTTNGIPVGVAPRSGPAGASLMSGRYVLRQVFSITNISGQALTGIQFFKFLHSLETTRATYDDRNYGPTLNGQRYVIAQQGQDTGINYNSGTPVLHRDTVALHANLAPSAWEVGYYGIEGVDDHIFDKPSVGVHLSVEANALSGSDLFAPPTKWISGAVRCELGSLAPNASTNIEFLMTIQTVTTSLPLKIKRSGTNVLVSWPVGSLDFESYYLESTPSLKNPNWQWVTQPVNVENGENVVKIPITSQPKYFRVAEFDIY